MTAKETGTADNWHYFSYDTKAGTAGIARSMSFGGGKGSGSFCLPADYKKRRTAISEWMQSDAKTSLVRLFLSSSGIYRCQNHFIVYGDLNLLSFAFFRHLHMSLATPWACLMTSAPMLIANRPQKETMEDRIALAMHVGVIA